MMYEEMLTEEEYKKKLREEILYFRSHSNLEISKNGTEYSKYSISRTGYKVDELKEIYDKIPENLLDEFINQSYIKYKNIKEIKDIQFKNSNEYFKIEESINEIENLDPESLKLKNHVKNSLKKLVSEIDLKYLLSSGPLITLGVSGLATVVGFSIPAVSLGLENGFSDPAIKELSSKFPQVFGSMFLSLLAFFIARDVVVFGYKTLKEYIDNLKNIDYLKELGIYDKLKEKILAEEEVKNIIGKGSVR